MIQVLFWVVSVLFGTTHSSWADESALSALSDSSSFVRRSAVIALVEVTDHRKVDGHAEDGLYFYTAKVLDEVKGPPVTTLKFFSPLLLDERRSQKYLIVAYARSCGKQEREAAECIAENTYITTSITTSEEETLNQVETRTLDGAPELWVSLESPYGWFVPEDYTQIRRDLSDGHAFVRWSYTRSLIEEWVRRPTQP